MAETIAGDTHAPPASGAGPRSAGSSGLGTGDTIDADRDGPGPSILGRFAIEREIGHGGMGRAYEARDPELGREVAVKLAHRAATAEGSRATTTRFIAEARITAQLEHPNVVPVYDVGMTIVVPIMEQSFANVRPCAGPEREGDCADGPPNRARGRLEETHDDDSNDPDRERSAHARRARGGRLRRGSGRG